MIPAMRPRTTLLGSLALTLALRTALPAHAESPPSAIPSDLLTVAERTDFRATATYDQTLRYLEALEQRMPELQLGYYGSSGAGRPLPLVVVSKDRAFVSKRAKRTGKPIVMVQNGIHAGEIDGKDATLMLLRDLALGRDRELLDHLILLVVPIYNVDGHERVSPYSRATQNGPVDGMGWRATAQGLDLNRDYLKLAAPESRALLRLWNDWQPHLHVDNHVTDGIDHGWRLTWMLAEPPLLAEPLHRWAAPRLRAALAAAAAQGHVNGPYVDLVDRADPAKGISSVLEAPRYSTVYFPLRNRASVLVETNAHVGYRERVLANLSLLRALLREVARDPAGLVAATAAADQAAAARRGEAVLTWEAEPGADRIAVPLPQWKLERSLVTGAPTLVTSPPTRELEVPWFRRLRPARTVPRPAGYLVLPGWPEIEQRLRDHALAAAKLRAPVELEVETLRLSSPTFEPAPFQGRIRVSAAVERRAERRPVPVGALWVPAEQPGFEVAIQLLEPEAPDSLFAWGFLDAVLERKEWVPVRVLDRFASERLAADATLRQAWEEALRDPQLAASEERRQRWWYERSPWFDETVGMLPYYRVMATPSLTTQPWH
jgi:hypothetical protein